MSLAPSRGLTNVRRRTRCAGSRPSRNPTGTKRGDVVTVAAPGDFGKPRPAVVVQTDAFPSDHDSVVVCQMTSVLEDAPDFRVTVEATPGNGLRATSQIMADTDKPVTVRRRRIGARIGSLSRRHVGQLNSALAFVIGLSD